LADVPATPLVAPYGDYSITTTNRVKIDMNAITDDGDSPILSYSLEVDDGRGGLLMPMYGVDTNSLSLTYTFSSGVQRGLTYRARYRSRNSVGWSAYSPIGYITAAVKPSAPLTPTFIEATSTTIKINLWTSEDNGGSPIITYYLERDDGNSGAFQAVTTYSSPIEYLFD